MIKKVCDACDNWEQAEMSHLPVFGWDVITIKSDLGEIGATFDLCPDCANRLREGSLIEGMIDILTAIKNKRNNTTPDGLVLEINGAEGYFPVEYIKVAIDAHRRQVDRSEIEKLGVNILLKEIMLAIKREFQNYQKINDVIKNLAKARGIDIWKEEK